MEKRQKTINGRNYQLLVPPVRPAMALCTRVAALLGPALGSLGGQADDGGWSRFAVALQAVDPLKADALFMDAVDIARLTYENKLINTAIDFEKHFSQFRADVYPVCAWTLWESVRDFFPQLADFIPPNLTAQGLAALQSQKDGK